MNEYLIDRAARDVVAEQLRHLITGLITNDQFEDQLPVTADRAVHAAAEAAWALYDDLHEHTLTGRYALSPEAKRAMALIILFLKTNQPWPHPTGGMRFVLATVVFFVLLAFQYPIAVPPALLAFVAAVLVIRRWQSDRADADYYPFGSEEALSAARARAPYLNGAG